MIFLSVTRMRPEGRFFDMTALKTEVEKDGIPTISFLEYLLFFLFDKKQFNY